MKAKCEQQSIGTFSLSKGIANFTHTPPPLPPQQHTLFEWIRFSVNELESLNSYPVVQRS